MDHSDIQHADKTTYDCPHAMPETGYIRVKDVLRYIPVSRSTWWAGVKEGRFPKPVKLGPRMTAWRVQDIRNFIDTVQ